MDGAIKQRPLSDLSYLIDSFSSTLHPAHPNKQEALERLSYETGVPTHRIFMACPSNLNDFSLYSGVRIITH